MKIWWDDGYWAVVEAIDLPPLISRSRTNDTVGDAVKSQSWDAALVNAVGPKSLHKFVKIRLQDVPPGWVTNKVAPLPRLNLSPSNFGGTSRSRSIPDYPQKCAVCGGGLLMLFTSIEHEGGSCPGPVKGRKLMV